MPEPHILPTPDAVAQAGAEFIAALAERRSREEGRFTIALSGGSTPRRLYQFIAAPPYREQIAWSEWQVFWSDERCVPPDHRDSNYRMAREALLDHVPIPASQIYRIRGEAEPEQAAQEYEQELHRVFGTVSPAFDLVLLGIGEDGHTASLFPGTIALEEERRLVVANWVPQLQAHRVTFTLPLINAARDVVFIVVGESKAEVVRQVLTPAPGGRLPPAAMVRASCGTVHWFLTKEAARLPAS